MGVGEWLQREEAFGEGGGGSCAEFSGASQSEWTEVRVNLPINATDFPLKA